MLLEVCAHSFESAHNAQAAGAQRIEICSELSVGGVTASYGLLKKVTEELTIDTYALIRPRGGNFTYSESEFEVMKRNIILCKGLGCKGIVSGILHPNNTIDLVRTQELIDLAKPLEFTFHRGFDWTPFPRIALEQLIDLGANRVLTSGQSNSAESGLQLLIELKNLANDRITILPGGGVNVENVTLFKEAGFCEVHGSLLEIEKVNDTPPLSMQSNQLYNETHLANSSLRRIEQLITCMNK